MKTLYVVSLVVLVVGVGVALFMRSVKVHTSPGTVIILNGPSGSGKSSIQKAFQQLMMPNMWLKLGIDMLFDAPLPNITPENMDFWQSPNPIRWVEKSQDKQQNAIITLFVGEQGQKVVSSMNSAIAEYAKNGCNVIVDYIAYDQAWLADLEKKLGGIKTYWVKVAIPLDVLEEREAARGTSPKGHARSHYGTVYGDRNYDLTVDSHKNSALDIAVQLKQLIGL